MRRLVVDAQVFQTPAWHRGMGKYSVELLAALHALNETHKIWDGIDLLFSSRLDINEEVLQTAKERYEKASIVKLDLKSDNILNPRPVLSHNRDAINAYVDTLLQDTSREIDFLILSPMQGGICAVFPTRERVLKSLIFYDLIPFMFHHIYFRNPIAKMESSTKLGELLKADVYLAISKTVANDLAVHLGIDPDRIVSINGGPIAHSRKQKEYPIDAPFILMPTGNELRKNNRLGIVGFSEFNKAHRGKYKLVITSSFDPGQIAELSRLDPNVVFTGNISGAELNYLYAHCEALLFPSEYEGLGLPVLEAAENGKSVACSDISVFREMSKTAFHMFDQTSGTSIAEALEQAITTPIDKKEYAKVLGAYTWPDSARKAADALRQARSESIESRPRLTILGPNPSGHSRAARMLLRSHAELSRLADVSYFFEGHETHEMRPNVLPYVTEARALSIESPIKLPEDRTLVYYLENNAKSAQRLFCALARPGIVVLDDSKLDVAWQAMLEKGFIADSRFKAEVALDKKYATLEVVLLVSLVATQQVFIVFDKRHKLALETLATQLDKSIAVTFIESPTSNIVYTDILPTKSATLAALHITPRSHPAAVFAEAEGIGYKKIVSSYNEAPDEQADALQAEALGIRNDHAHEDFLSRLNLSFCADDEAALDSIEGLRYGLIPVWMPSRDLHVPPLAGSQKAEGVGDVNKILKKLVPGMPEQLTAMKNVMSGLNKRHYKVFADQIVELVKEKSSKNE